MSKHSHMAMAGWLNRNMEEADVLWRLRAVFYGIRIDEDHAVFPSKGGNSVVTQFAYSVCI
jgi:hypothetical protein